MSRRPIIDEAPGVVASVERIEAWLQVSTPGDEFVYATRLALPVASRGAAHLRALQDAGEVELFQRRTAEGTFNYVARRRAVPAVAGLPQRPRPVPAAMLSEEASRLLAMLRGVTRNGLPCPGNPLIARELGLARPSYVSELFGELAETGHVAVEQIRRAPHRVVTLLATGQQTARP